jgi:hypothetical protein
MVEEPPPYFHTGAGIPHSPQPHPYLNPPSCYSVQQALPARGSKQATLGMNHGRRLPTPPHLIGQPSMMPMETTNMWAGQQPADPTVMMPMAPMFMPQCNTFYYYYYCSVLNNLLLLPWFCYRSDTLSTRATQSEDWVSPLWYNGRCSMSTHSVLNAFLIIIGFG